MFKWITRLLSAAVAALVFGWALRINRAKTPNNTTPSIASLPATSGLSCGDKVIRAQSVGLLSIGMTIDSLKEKCRLVTDTIQPGPEGMTERRGTVAFPPDFVEAEIVDGRVWRIDVDSPVFRTADSLGVGSSVSDLLRDDDPNGGTGEGAFFVISRKHCGLSYQLSGGIPSGPARRWDRKGMATLPASTRVVRVLVSTCPPSRAIDSARAQ
jgi:hypothetical protein